MSASTVDFTSEPFVTTYPADAVALFGRRYAQRTAVSRFSEPTQVQKTETKNLFDPLRNGALVDEQLVANAHIQVIRRRLRALAQAYFDDYAQMIDQESEKGFLCLMEYHPRLAIPLISAESTGLITATWVKGVECVSLRFIDRHRLHFALTYAIAGQIKREWNDSSLATVFESAPNAKRIAAGA